MHTLSVNLSETVLSACMCAGSTLCAYANVRSIHLCVRKEKMFTVEIMNTKAPVREFTCYCMILCLIVVDRTMTQTKECMQCETGLM